MDWAFGGIAALLLTALYLFLIFPGRSKRTQRAPFCGRTFAHRGLYDPEQTIPENSLAAFRRAKEHGYGVELDVQLTKDKQLVVFHDASLLRMTGSEGGIGERTYAQLQQLRLCGTEERIPLFAEVMALLDGAVPVIVELKPHQDVAELSRLVLSVLRTLKGPYCVESFDPRVVRWFRKHAPDILRGQLSEGYRQWRKHWNPFLSMMMHRMWINFLTRPQFLAFGSGTRPLCWFVAKCFGCMLVHWTVRPHESLPLFYRRYDALIFEHFLPDAAYPPPEK